MTFLQGGIEENVMASGGGGGAAAANPYAAIAMAAEEKKKNIKNSFGNFAKNTNSLAQAVNNFTPNFQPIASGFIAPQQMQTQQSTMPSLYKYLVS